MSQEENLNKTRAIINLSACRHNLSIAQQAAPDSKCIAIIKANAYGHGMIEIAKALQNTDAFGVARIQEAIALRDAGIKQPILLLEGFTSEKELKFVQQYNIKSVIHNDYQIQLLEQLQGDNVSIVIKVDSGMHRLGFNPNEVIGVIEKVKQCKVVQSPIKLMTHFANADDKQDNKTLDQIDVFYKSAEAYLEKNITTEISIANSAGILGWPQSHATWNRPGIMLYGVSPFLQSTALDHNLKPVMTLESQLISIKQVPKGDSIGYGSTYICDKEMTVGIVAIGYGDGYPRHAKTGTPVLVNGQRCALLGRVSMDMICIDLTGIKNVDVCDVVTLWGDGLPIEEVAESAETIAYELLCGVTQRVEIKYLDE